jgi:hypothetical protein
MGCWVSGATLNGSRAIANQEADNGKNEPGMETVIRAAHPWPSCLHLARISHTVSPSRENRGGERRVSPIFGSEEKTRVGLGNALRSQMLPAVCGAITGQ